MLFISPKNIGWTEFLWSEKKEKKSIRHFKNMAKREGASNRYHKWCGKCGGSGGVLFLIIQVVVEGDNSADKFPQLHEIGSDDVYSIFPGPLWADPLHHARKSPERTQIHSPFQSKGICSQTEWMSVGKIAQFQNIVSCLCRLLTFKVASWLLCNWAEFATYKIINVRNYKWSLWQK